jgi:hypothetical protein
MLIPHLTPSQLCQRFISTPIAFGFNNRGLAFMSSTGRRVFPAFPVNSSGRPGLGTIDKGFRLGRVIERIAWGVSGDDFR